MSDPANPSSSSSASSSVSLSPAEQILAARDAEEAALKAAARQKGTSGAQSRTAVSAAQPAQPDPAVATPAPTPAPAAASPLPTPTPAPSSSGATPLPNLLAASILGQPADPAATSVTPAPITSTPAPTPAPAVTPTPTPDPQPLPDPIMVRRTPSSGTPLPMASSAALAAAATATPAPTLATPPTPATATPQATPTVPPAAPVNSATPATSPSSTPPATPAATPPAGQPGCSRTFAYGSGIVLGVLAGAMVIDYVKNLFKGPTDAADRQTVAALDSRVEGNATDINKVRESVQTLEQRTQETQQNYTALSGKVDALAAAQSPEVRIYRGEAQGRIERVYLAQEVALLERYLSLARLATTDSERAQKLADYDTASRDVSSKRLALSRSVQTYVGLPDQKASLEQELARFGSEPAGSPLRDLATEFNTLYTQLQNCRAQASGNAASTPTLEQQFGNGQITLPEYFRLRKLAH